MVRIIRKFGKVDQEEEMFAWLKRRPSYAISQIPFIKPATEHALHVEFLDISCFKESQASLNDSDTKYYNQESIKREHKVSALEKLEVFDVYSAATMVVK
uniref:Uncharacterized protein n=1 Tax=Salix viminalis TaxID=40686 RepID=A0A6N2K0Q2_SALVM